MSGQQGTLAAELAPSAHYQWVELKPACPVATWRSSRVGLFHFERVPCRLWSLYRRWVSVLVPIELLTLMQSTHHSHSVVFYKQSNLPHAVLGDSQGTYYHIHDHASSPALSTLQDVALNAHWVTRLYIGRYPQACMQGLRQMSIEEE